MAATKTTGFTALLDVLGFKALISGEGHAERLQKYLDTVRAALAPIDGIGHVDVVTFSDSIVLTTRDDSSQSLQSLLFRCSRVFWELLYAEIPIRGAVGHGSYFREESSAGSFVAGRAIVDAYELEIEQDWVGIALAATALTKLPTLDDSWWSLKDTSAGGLGMTREFLAWKTVAQICGKIPFHKVHPLNNREQKGIAIVPTNVDLTLESFRPEKMQNSLKIAIQKLSRLQALAPTPEAQDKYVMPIEWLGEICINWQLVRNEWANVFG